MAWGLLEAPCLPQGTTACVGRDKDNAERGEEPSGTGLGRGGGKGAETPREGHQLTAQTVSLNGQHLPFAPSLIGFLSHATQSILRESCGGKAAGAVVMTAQLSVAQ